MKGNLPTFHPSNPVLRGLQPCIQCIHRAVEKNAHDVPETAEHEITQHEPQKKRHRLAIDPKPPMFEDEPLCNTTDEQRRPKNVEMEGNPVAEWVNGPPEKSTAHDCE